MLKAERQAIILQLLNEKGFIKSDELIDQLGVSHVTVRRDLLALSSQNLVKLEHGGASGINYLEGLAEPLYDTKLYVNSEAKNAMAEFVVQNVKDGDILVLDSGTTNYRLAQKLKTKKFSSLTVITSDIMVAKELSSHPNISVNVLGGILRKSYFNVYGPFTELILSKLKANKLFIGFDGASISRGLSLNILEEVPVKQRMMEICDEIIAFGDSSKFGTDAPFSICGWENITQVIVDASIKNEYIEFFKERNIVCDRIII
jgi:DeoR/GlpR family transcriptional regulator of sugar metabolism